MPGAVRGRSSTGMCRHGSRMPAQLPHDRPFSTAEAVSRGVSRHRLRTLLANGELKQPARGWYERVGMGRILARDAANRAELHSAPLVSAHVTAAALHGLRVPTPDERLFFVCPRAEQQPDYGPSVVVLPAGVGPGDITTLAGTAVTTLERTALDLARGCSLEFALVPIDHALTLGATLASLRSARERMRGWPGTRILDVALAHADGRSESALESMSRGAMITAGLSTPRLQYTTRGRSGKRWRADFVWVDEKVIGEADGFGKYATRGEHEKQTFRDEDLKAAGWTVVHWTFEQMLTGGRPALRWLADALNHPLNATPPRAHRPRHSA